MSDTPTNDDESEAPDSELRLSDVLAVLNELGNIAKHAFGKLNLDWTPRGVLKTIRLVISANMQLRTRVSELEATLRKEQAISAASRIAMNEALTFFTDEAAKFPLSEEDRQRINEQVSSTRATIFPEAAKAPVDPASTDPSPTDPIAIELEETDDRVTRELFLDLEGPSIQPIK